MIAASMATMAEGMSYPLARRNQPQWLQVADFLVSQALNVPGLTLADLRRRAEGAPLAGKSAAALSGIPDGNHGDNVR
jgi:hypothetical protein